MDTIIAILGSFISLLLMVNAFFTRKTLEKISSIELKLAEMIIKHDYTDERAKGNRRTIENINTELLSLRERVHSLEGASSQKLQFRKEMDQ